MEELKYTQREKEFREKLFKLLSENQLGTHPPFAFELAEYFLDIYNKNPYSVKFKLVKENKDET